MRVRTRRTALSSSMDRAAAHSDGRPVQAVAHEGAGVQSPSHPPAVRQVAIRSRTAESSVVRIRASSFAGGTCTSTGASAP